MLDFKSPPDMTGAQAHSEALIKQRLDLAAFLVVGSAMAVFIAVFRPGVVAFLWIGPPIALIAFGLKTRRLGRVKIGLLIAWSAIGIFFCYCLPYLICPLQLPSSARNLYVADEGFWLACHCEVRFNATVDDCIVTAQQVQRQFADEVGIPVRQPEKIDRAHGVLPPHDHWGQRRRWWLDVDSIQNGLYYRGGGSWEPEMWIDTDRGIFYFRVSD